MIEGTRHRWAYRSLGGAAPYFLHLRPMEWPIMAAHTALGYCLAVGLGGLATGSDLDAGLLGLLLWVVCLNGGTLALNSAFDHDEGDIAYLRQPPPVPRHLAAWGLGLMLLGQGVSLLLPPLYRIVYALCFVMSVLYSVPPVRLKAVAGADWIINMLGFGTLTPLAGWLATGLPLDAGHLLLLAGFCPLFAALYPLTQIYQVEEDRRRGDVTLVIRLGVRRSLAIAIGAALVAFACFFGSLSLLLRASPLRVTGVGGALGAWLAVLLPWYAGRERMSAPEHQRGMYLALGAWAVTDVVALLAWG